MYIDIYIFIYMYIYVYIYIYIYTHTHIQTQARVDNRRDKGALKILHARQAEASHVHSRKVMGMGNETAPG